jgi:hypothetical protein
MNQNINQNSENYSFDDILKASFLELSNKIFMNNNTKECLGLIWAKYSSTSKLDAIANKGIIEFISPYEKTTIIKIYGKDYEKDVKIFHACFLAQEKKNLGKMNEC